MSKPKITFDLYENSSGLIGFEPRVTGWPVWIDNVKVTSIKKFQYNGPDLPNIEYEPDSLLTSWESIGPFRKPIKMIERESGLSNSTITVDGQSSTGTAGVNDMDMGETAPLTQHPQSDLGTITLRSAGDLTLSLQATTIDPNATWGVKVMGIELALV